MSWPGCLCVLLPLPVCQLALCGASEPDLLAASGRCAQRFHGGPKKSEREREREEETGMSEMVCVACAAKLTGAGCPGCVHA